MKTIKVFLASSEELKEDRKEFVDMISKLNFSYNPKGINFQPLIWEYMSNSLREKTKQEEYNEHIRGCDVFVALFHTRAGKYTREELELAYNVHCNSENKCPTIQVYVRTPAEGVVIDSSLIDFLKELEERYNHFKDNYTHIDTLKYEFLAQFTMLENEQKLGLTIHNGKVCIDGVEFVDFENLSFASKNSDLIRLKDDLEKLDHSIEECNTRIEKISKRLLKDPDDEEYQEDLKMLESKLYDLDSQRQTLLDDIQKHENSLLDFSLSLAREKSKSSSSQIRNALERFNRGESKEARALLEELTTDIQSTAKELISLKNIAQEKLSYLKDQINGVLLQADEVMTQYENQDRFTHACEFYQRAIECGKDCIAERDQVENIITYAKFLKANNEFNKAEHYYAMALEIYKDSIGSKDKENIILADILSELGFVQRVQNSHSSAETKHNEALKIYRILAESNPNTYFKYIANTLNNLAYIHYILNDFTLAKQEYNEALEIISSLNKSGNYDFEESFTLNSLANLHKDLHEYSLAEEKYTKALEIRKSLAEKNPNTYLPYLAITLNNLGNLHSELNNHLLAEQEYDQALEIRMNLVDKSPKAYKSAMATTLNNLASLHSDSDYAETLVDEALSIYRFFEKTSPAAYAPCVAIALNNLAIIHSKLENYTLAEDEYNIALVMRRKLAAIAPNAYNVDLATTLGNLAVLHAKLKNDALAREEILEAIQIIQDLLSNNKTELNPYLEKILDELLPLSNKLKEGSIGEAEINKIILKQPLKLINSL